MPSDFAELGKRLEQAIFVPELSISSIRSRSRNKSRQHRSHVLIACALLVIGVLGSGTVLAAIKYRGVRLWLSGDKAAIVVRSFTSIPNPKAEDLRRLSAMATFPVVFPGAIPKRMHLGLIIFSPADRPSFIYVQYRNGKTGSSWGFPLFDSADVNADALPPLPDGEKPLFGSATEWTVGRETVVMPAGSIGPNLAEIKDAMLRLTPAQSLSQALPRLRRITVLGGVGSIADAAEAIAPAQGRSVLLDRGNLTQVATLAREHKALFSIKAITVENLPMIHGRPDFAHQSSHFNKELAVPAYGVRAVAILLASGACGSGGRMGSGFSCEMLVNQRSGGAYWIWTLPLNASTPPKKYVVSQP